MAEDELPFIIRILSDYEELTTFETAVDALATKWEKVKLTIKNEGRKVLQSINGIIGLVKNVFKAYGIALSPLAEGILNVIGAAVSAAIAMQAAYAAGGPVGWAMMLISFGSLLIALEAEHQALEGVDNAKQKFNEVNAILNSLSSVISPWGY